MTRWLLLVWLLMGSCAPQQPPRIQAPAELTCPKGGNCYIKKVPWSKLC